jgi:hypothetical protein
MTRPPPELDPRRAGAKPVAPPEPADYSDEITPAQLAELRKFAPQDESLMGALVHEFRW